MEYPAASDADPAGFSERKGQQQTGKLWDMETNPDVGYFSDHGNADLECNVFKFYAGRRGKYRRCAGKILSAAYLSWSIIAFKFKIKVEISKYGLAKLSFIVANILQIAAVWELLLQGRLI